MHYKGNIFHRIMKGIVAQGGDITNLDGTGGVSIYGERFDDEQIWYTHTHKGVLSTANEGTNTNGSQFLICLSPVPHLNFKHTVFGRVISGYDLIEKIEDTATDQNDFPEKAVTIVDCGELLKDDKLTEETADFL